MQKNRNWTFVLYPESCVENWIDILSERGCEFAVSPLHDKDVNANGELKKAHWHIQLRFDGPMSYDYVKKNVCDLVGGTIPQACISSRGMYRYLCHLDNPEKHQYDVKDIQCFGGFKIDLTTSEITMIKFNICNDIENNEIKEYQDLCNYYKELGDFDYFEVVSNHTYFFDRYLTSGRHKVKNNKTEYNI